MLSLIVLFILSLLFILPQAEASDKYKPAIKTATEAALKQSGLEADFIKARNAAEKKARKILQDSGLGPVAPIVGFVVPVVYRQKMRIKVDNFLFEIKSNKAEVTWRFQF